MSTDAVLFEKRGHIGLITLNRPDNRNSMTSELLDAFGRAAETAARDKDLRVVVITGTGKCFSSGADFKSQIQRDDGAFALPHEKSYAMYRDFLKVLDIEVPVIAALNGHTVGGGFGLSLVCDIRIANKDAKYGANFTKLGLAPGMSISYLLPRIVGMSKASELLFTAELFSGEEGARIGYASRAVAAEEVLPSALALAENIATSSPIAVRLTKRNMYAGMGYDVRAHAYMEAYGQAETVATEDAKEGIAALLEKRAPKFVGR